MRKGLLPSVLFPGQIYVNVLSSVGPQVLSSPGHDARAAFYYRSLKGKAMKWSAPAFLPEGISREWKSVILLPLSTASDSAPPCHHGSHAKTCSH